MDTTEQQCRRYLGIFILIQLVFWTLVPWLTRHNIPFDTIEGIAWGNQWQWGYDKHPMLAAWLCALFSKVSIGFPVYLLAQLAVVATYWAVWRIAKQILTPAQALVCVLVLSSIWYYTIATPKINPNTLMTPVWMLTALAFYTAFEKNTLKYWIITGLLSGLCMLCKYQSAVFLLSMFALLLFTQKGRAHFKSCGLYIALILFVLVWSPNLYWNAHHHWSEIQYALGRGGDFKTVSHGIGAHFYWPYYFFIQQLGSLAVSLILVAFLWRCNREKTPISRTQKQFLGFLGLGPLAITLAISFVCGMYLYAKWGTPYFSLLPAFIIALRRPHINAQWLKVYFIIGVACIILSAFIRGSFLLFGPAITSRAHPDAYFPGPQIANRVTHLWHTHAKGPLKYIAGSHYLAANIAVYAKSQPAPYMGWSHAQSAWANDHDLKKSGAMFAWWDTKRQGLPKNIKARFPKAKYLGDFVFQKATNTKVTPVIIGIAYLPAR
jgi:hypothetical protein